MESLRGQLLVSSGGLYDPNFRHTVVLIGEHHEDGAVGIVLNRALDRRVRDVIPLLGELVEPGSPLFDGGPVQPARAVLLAEFSDADMADMSVFGNVGFLVGDVSDDVRSGIVRARIFVGHSGWGPGQLERELDEESWLIEPAQEDDVFTDAPELLWSRVVRRKGPEYDLMSRMPFDPSMN